MCWSGWLEKQLMLMLICCERKILLFHWKSTADKFKRTEPCSCNLLVHDSWDVLVHITVKSFCYDGMAAEARVTMRWDIERTIIFWHRRLSLSGHRASTHPPRCCLSLRFALARPAGSAPSPAALFSSVARHTRPIPHYSAPNATPPSHVVSSSTSHHRQEGEVYATAIPHWKVLLWLERGWIAY
jgi:hypothetical protein